MRVILSAKARSDLQEIGDYIAADNPRRAVTFVLELRRSCLDLSEHPLRYPVINGTITENTAGALMATT